MTQYYFVDESGDPGLEGQASSSSHFVISMVQLPARASRHPLVNLRKTLQVKTTFEFKYHTTTASQKDLFFKEVLHIPFRVRAVALHKARIGVQLRNLQRPELVTKLIIRLTFRASELDIANGVCFNQRYLYLPKPAESPPVKGFKIRIKPAQFTHLSSILLDEKKFHINSLN